MESSKMFPANILCSSNTSTKESEAIVDSPLSCSLESSEQNSPYTDSAVETFNILNQNFERWVRRVYHSYFVCNVKTFCMACIFKMHFKLKFCLEHLAVSHCRNFCKVIVFLLPFWIFSFTVLNSSTKSFI